MHFTFTITIFFFFLFKACLSNKFQYIEKTSPMQSLSHQDSEKVFGEKFLFEATFIFYFTFYNKK